ncbi:MAG: type II toxin-antitoxin system RelE/ParE family toxin [Jaaginema sp. PMC 1079.18]|nr:type II toxin-antitoxin system RelE/ParE family toxin [Jaaginema sp. PMC 1080.18]MEC4850025.1 type II toxin-antitoxin system RelE/ParE family toxin [Jaaginema sp. PMC 1079.18]MEC4867445.1 type II toxin-antitoxin system RelE/ParE family toxin [Jaaginema sp. PMC 1078.18]
MSEILKRPQVIRDLIDIATYIAENNLESGERFLKAAEDTFKQLGQMPQLGKQCQFTNLRLQNVRQLVVKGFKNYLIFYQVTATGVEILRVIHGSRDIEVILEGDDRDNL